MRKRTMVIGFMAIVAFVLSGRIGRYVFQIGAQ
jgi:hypothetical protein